MPVIGPNPLRRCPYPRQATNHCLIHQRQLSAFARWHSLRKSCTPMRLGIIGSAHPKAAGSTPGAATHTRRRQLRLAPLDQPWRVRRDIDCGHVGCVPGRRCLYRGRAHSSYDRPAAQLLAAGLFQHVPQRASGLFSNPPGCLGRHFVHMGCGGFVGALWPVTEQGALAFARAFYQFLVQEYPISEAIRLARQRVRQEFPNDPTWLAYRCFADPMARIGTLQVGNKSTDRTT